MILILSNDIGFLFTNLCNMKIHLISETVKQEASIVWQMPIMKLPRFMFLFPNPVMLLVKIP